MKPPKQRTTGNYCKANDADIDVRIDRTGKGQWRPLVKLRLVDDGDDASETRESEFYSQCTSQCHRLASGWHTVVFTREAGVGKLYLDGEDVSSSVDQVSNSLPVKGDDHAVCEDVLIDLSIAQVILAR